MKINQIYTGEALEILKTFSDESINCCITSPPYYGLRDYGVVGQIGLEKTPEDYIKRLVAVFREVRRVLRRDGTLWVNVGDCYAGSGKGGATYPENAKKYKQGTNRGLIGAEAVSKVGWGQCKHKDLIGIPWMLAFALRNDGWYLRSDIIWAKTNPMPESVKDRPTKSHEYIFLLSKSAHYYYDADAIKEPCVGLNNEPPAGSKGTLGSKNSRYRKDNIKHLSTIDIQELRNKRDVWTISVKPYKGAHFATFPPDLIKPCILAGCPKDGICLDPFVGSGTTAATAIRLNRNYVGIEINPNYVIESNRRLQNISHQQELR